MRAIRAREENVARSAQRVAASDQRVVGQPVFAVPTLKIAFVINGFAPISRSRDGVASAASILAARRDDYTVRAVRIAALRYAG